MLGIKKLFLFVFGDYFEFDLILNIVDILYVIISRMLKLVLG